jgi:alpha-mannosidase
LLNDGKYSFDVNIRDMGLTVLRSPIYAHHMPLVPDPEQIYTYMDQGVQKFRYTLLPHAGSWDEARHGAQRAELNQRPVVAGDHHPRRPAAAQRQFVCVDQENLVVSAVKKPKTTTIW